MCFSRTARSTTIKTFFCITEKTVSVCNPCGVMMWWCFFSLSHQLVEHVSVAFLNFLPRLHQQRLKQLVGPVVEAGGRRCRVWPVNLWNVSPRNTCYHKNLRAPGRQVLYSPPLFSVKKGLFFRPSFHVTAELSTSHLKHDSNSEACYSIEICI